MNDDGFLFVKFDASPTVSLPETDALDAFVQSNGLQTQPNWVAGQTIEGAFNWKLGSECLFDTFLHVHRQRSNLNQ